MLARVFTSSVLGIDGLLVEVEVDVSFGLPHFSIVGLPGEEVRESRDRVRAALKNSGYKFPAERIVVNLAPASVRKTGASFDLPIAVGIALASGQATPAGGSEIVMVSAFGNQFAICQPSLWVDSGGDLVATVRCFDATGAPKDHQFWVVLIE